ncbi:MAG: hypothetical protein ACYDEX_12660 [Mobilitalea sp.]
MISLKMTIDIQNYLNMIKNTWLSTDYHFPDFLPEISKETKANNELYVQTVSDDFQKHLKNFPRIPIGRKKWKLKMLNHLKDVLYKETIISLHKSTDQKTIDAFQEEIKAFLHQVRIFAPELTFSDIGQAIRNYMVYVMFNEINQRKSAFNMAGFGYSMLYPFTDNYIDSTKYSAKEKLAYNQIIRDKIEGKEVHPISIHQRKTCNLLQAIESEYPRDIDSTIYELLLMMLEAQEDSIRQQNKGILLTADERLDISLYKGGISVLIDRFFVKKELTKEDYIFYLGMGFFLQLADDLQDIKEDSMQGHQTIFTIDLHCEQEEMIVNKMLHFIHQIMADYQADNDIFKNFVLTNCYQLIFTSAVGSKEFFSPKYLGQLEKHLPITYPYLENMRSGKFENKDIKIQDKYMKMLDEILL